MKGIFLLAAALYISIAGVAQKGTLTVTFTPANGKVITADYASLIKARYAVNDYSAYWFVNPHTGLHHAVITLNNKQGGSTAFLSSSIELNSQQNDYRFWNHHQQTGDSNFVAMDKALFVISAPIEYDEPSLGGTTNHNDPMLVHITTITPGELEFTITGNAEYGTKEGDGKFLGYGNIQVHGHFYREAGYERSPTYPGCDCDPTIYATIYDTEESDKRTASACEVIMLNKIFNTAKHSLAPIHGMAFSGSGAAPEGALMLRTLDHYDVSPSIPARPYWPFDYAYKTTISRGLIDGQKRYYNTDDFGIELDEMPGKKAMDDLTASSKTVQNTTMQQFQAMDLPAKQARIDSLGKLVQAKKITLQEYSDKVREIMAPVNDRMNAAISSANKQAEGNDFGKMNMESKMLITFSFNPREAFSYMVLDKSISKSDVQVLHTVAGAAYVIKAPAVKDGDGNWDRHKCYVLLGRYNPPTVGKHDDYYTYAVNINPLYPATANKLLVYNIIVKMEGGEDQINKALSNMDFNALGQLITPQ